MRDFYQCHLNRASCCKEGGPITTVLQIETVRCGGEGALRVTGSHDRVTDEEDKDPDLQTLSATIFL